MQIAVYGKGGIGKSTVCSNLSAALALKGSRVLQIGCDPKHDSTRLLHHGKKVCTVLDYILNTPPDQQHAEDVLMDGYMGVCCVEAGGPRPGMGCAGRGILTCFDFLDKYSVISKYDTVVYDVLGDVVCGGFAVPVRRQYANAVFLVTSGEAMALYAANNILQGIKNLDPEEYRIAGIIYNSRGTGDDRKTVETFAEAVELPIVMSIPRSEAFTRAERLAQTVVEAATDSIEAGCFITLAGKIRDGISLFEAKPLDEDRMERLLQGQPLDQPERKDPVPVNDTWKQDICIAAEATSGSVVKSVIPKKRALADPFSRVPMYGCAYRGAVDLAVHIKDAAVLGHAPKSCTWYAVHGITKYGRRGLFERGVLYPAFIPRNFENTDITVQDAIFGGVEHAREKALKLAESGIGSIIAPTACIPGLCGDDLTPVKNELKAMGCDMYIIHTDGVEAGDYNEGMALCYKTLAKEAVERGVEQDTDSINFVYEQTWSDRTDGNFMTLCSLLDAMDIRVNCRFLCATSMEKVRGFLRAPWNILARDDVLGRELKEIFETEYGCRFLDGGLPRGFWQTEQWVRKLGTLYKRKEKADVLVKKSRAEYTSKLEELRPLFRGKRVVLFSSQAGFEWLPEIVHDLEMDVVKEFIFGGKYEENPDWDRRFSENWETDRKNLRQTVESLRPDLVLTGDVSVLPDPPGWLTMVSVSRDYSVGFFAGTDAAAKWAAMLNNKQEGRWKHDRSLFEKFYC